MSALASGSGIVRAGKALPIATEIGTGATAYGVVVPDLPGCFSAGDTLDEAVTNAGGAVPAPSSIDAVRARADYAGWAFGVIAVDPAALDGSVERVNITQPRRVLLRLDAQARAAGESRSSTIAHLAREGRGER